ncbi:hypothetical protein E3T46_17355 [Cryobacterium sp. Hh11]|uniref:hypothetical protein n=1 Tax=Cryobacterium sp. Hh11 TaxID=2555868 RepID=UPI001069D034|nr:hypothetical protein [Cryobacterium sp. Hh11]TFD47563.1 hypothetical protein E3T46_17355 [Cryobacterium sp. Hh11]
MKITCALAIAAIVTAALSGCAGAEMEPVSIREVLATTAPMSEPTAEPVAPIEAPQSIEVPVETVTPVKPTTPAVKAPPAPAGTAPAAPAAPVPAPVAPIPVAPIVEPVVEPAPVETVDPFAAWLASPTFTCEEGFAPGWLNDAGIPTGCVAN